RTLHRRLALGVLAAAALTVWLVLQFAGPWLVALQERSGDWAWSQAASRTDERRLIIVDIDERSLPDIGPWPWPRATQAQLLDRLAQAGASQQILDIVFSEQRPGDPLLADSLRRHDALLAQ